MELCRRTEECLSLFEDASRHQALADDDWFEDRAADFVWWSHGLKAQKTGRSSLDYRLRDRPDIQKVIAGLLDSLAQALKDCLQPDDHEDEASESDNSSSGSSWSEFSDEVNQSKDKDEADTPNTEDSDPRFYIETNVKLLAKISIAIRRSGAKLRYLKADAYLKDHSDDDEYTQLRNHLFFLILVGPYEQKLFGELRRRTTNEHLPKAVEIVIRSWIVDPSRATSNQQRLVETNITRRNRIAYARRFISKGSVPTKSKDAAASTIVPSPFPDAVLRPAKEPSTFGADAQEPFPIADPIQALPIPPEPAKSPTAKTLTATELGSQFVLPVIVPFEPKKGAMSVATKITQTGIKQDYPACPGKKGSFQCPYCVQVLSEDYTVKSRWRGHVAQDLNPYSCIYQDCPDSHDLYATKEEWIKHIRSQHNEERWVCDDCIFESDQDDEFIFDSQELWESHMRSLHSCPDDRLILLCSMSKRKLVELAQCPLCKRPCGHSRPDEDDHIAEHLHSWALRALPWDLNPDDEASSDSPEMGSENDLARMSEMSELPEDEADSITAKVSDAIKREVTRWRTDWKYEDNDLSDRFYVLAKAFGEIIEKWSAHGQPDTQNETALQYLMSINQARFQLYHASELTAQQRQDMEDNLCISIELGVEYMDGLLGTEEEEPSREPSIDADEIERSKAPPPPPPPPPLVVGIPIVTGENIPPSDDEKEAILENARKHILHSNDREMQLVWARDVLVWAMTAEKVRCREPEPQPMADTERQLRTSALDIMEFLAQQDHPEALYHEGKWLELGQFGRAVDIEQALDRYRRAADGGSGRAHYRLGKLYQREWDDWETALKHYEKGEGMGDTAASLHLAFRYLYSSHFEEPDIEKGVALLKQSADNADEDAPQGAYVYGLAILGELPDLAIDESFLPKNTSTAFMYIEKSAYIGYSKAQWRLGAAYERGALGCPVDAAKSIHYFHLAARQGWGTAAYELVWWFLRGTRKEDLVVPDPALSFKFARWGASEDDGGAEHMMGYHYETGTYVLKDIGEARKWYERASNHGWGELQHLSCQRFAALEERDEFVFGVALDGQSRLGPYVEPRTLIVAMDVGEMFSSVSWADPVQLFDFDIKHVELFGSGDLGFSPHSQIPTQYDPETGAWGNPFLKAARLRKLTNTHRQSCFSLWKDLSSSIDQVRNQALGLLEVHSGDAVIVCDCGGTGARAASYEVLHAAPPLVHQLTSWDSEGFGTRSVDMEFIDYLLNRSGLSWRTSSKSARDELDRLIVEEWEYGIKRSFRGDERHDIDLQVPRRAIPVIRRLRRTSSTLSIRPETILKFFEKTLETIEQVVNAQLAALDAIGKKPNSIVLVGGMALSPCVFRHLRQKFDIAFHLPDMDGRSSFSQGVVELEYRHSVVNRSPFLAEVE
ncbi:uncharacterized protein NECHADRAFT_99311 [Fusarium vanettenii 77-13-4]|uniref:C2H2-type domain-containing protein n=1 Tax=Fusarium vanettenii (strain ATCC MYA-4622 / CBS 123669 / FGSC 9596 / NRRL 45880 / 77-13-4) TaxID=660122 RepID=C7Z4W1_FUSV7|nr:uncharacterized protein NECHADRAFT_99311 [Fusarium vanettenii 77-13-4]EEU40993.1 hypothetical protein NECHADRAFT_99311 [Fusarium vanettenii 77-13-4]